MPLVTDATGEKFGKSTGGGSLWLDPELTSPYAFFQYWINVDDADVGRYLRYFTFLSREEIEALDRGDRGAAGRARAAARRLAEEITTLVHGAEETAAVDRRERGAVRPGRAARARCRHAGCGADARRPHIEAGAADPERRPTCWYRPGWRPAGRRRGATIAEGGAYLNNVRVTDADAVPATADLLRRNWLVLAARQTHRWPG